MMRIFIIACLLNILNISTAWPSDDLYPLDKMTPDLLNKASLQRGVKYFMQYCFGCHSMRFQRYQRVAKDLGIPDDLMISHLIFNEDKISDFMFNGMTPAMGKEWFGAAPPDLTLVARVRGTDWLYTYLRTFYYDPVTPWKSNNLVFPNAGMPDIFEPIKGRMIKVCQDPADQNTCSLQPDPKYPGIMLPDMFDQMIYDLVNFMAYSAEPIKLERQRIGVYVILFLCLLLILACLLKREYWKDIH
ncbi:MAG: cytochrome c1 [Endozoicomonadaceae bacterium]|nr:cytochrome c1 [Endozoicomonadaceae bacterium]